MAKHDYQEIEVLRDPDGVIAVITKKGDTDYLSFSLQKEFVRRDTRAGETPGEPVVVRTSFLNRRHVAAVRRLLLKVEEYLDREADRNAMRVAATRRST